MEMNHFLCPLCLCGKNFLTTKARSKEENNQFVPVYQYRVLPRVIRIFRIALADVPWNCYILLDPFSPMSIPSFSELIRREEEFLKRLLVVSQRQLELAQAGSGTILNQLLERRERLWNEFEQLEEQLAPHKRVPPEQRIWKSPEERQLTESALNRCKALLEEIMANDQISLEKVEKHKNKAEQDFRRVQLTKPAATKYLKQSRQ